MAHCITTSRVFTAVFEIGGGRTDDRVPVTGEHVSDFQNPVLTVRDRATENSKEIRETSILFLPDALVVDPWGENRCDIVGEDLFALRELLNELPEEAFVAPKPTSRWPVGSVIVFTSTHTGVDVAQKTGPGPADWTCVAGSFHRTLNDRYADEVEQGVTNFGRAPERTVDTYWSFRKGA